MMFAILLLLMFPVVFFFSGCFESFIVKQCTQCGEKGKTTAISHIYAGTYYFLYRSGKIENVSIFGTSNKKPWGVIHDVHLCKKCCDDFFESMWNFR